MTALYQKPQYGEPYYDRGGLYKLIPLKAKQFYFNGTICQHLNAVEAFHCLVALPYFRLYLPEFASSNHASQPQPFMLLTTLVALLTKHAAS